MTGALLVPHQDVLDLVLLEDLVIDRKHRTARITEDVLDPVIGERAYDHRSAGHLVGVVALALAHGSLRIRLPLVRGRLHSKSLGREVLSRRSLGGRFG